MSQGTLYILPKSPRSNWLGILTQYLGLDIKVEVATGNEEFKKEFPLGKAPAFKESDDFKLTEFVAIVEYFLTISKDETYIGKTVKDRIQVLRWLSFENQEMSTTCGQYFFYAKTEEQKQALAGTLKSYLKYIEGELSTRSNVATDYVTIADVYLFTCYMFFAAAIGGISAEEFPNLNKWYETVKANDPLIGVIAKHAN